VHTVCAHSSLLVYPVDRASVYFGPDRADSMRNDFGTGAETAGATPLHHPSRRFDLCSDKKIPGMAKPPEYRDRDSNAYEVFTPPALQLDERSSLIDNRP
jgi:hypothetical protein